MLVMERREIINQSAAARLRGVSRQRISELYSKGRFTTPVDADGKLIKGAVYKDEVVSLKEEKRGRPRLTAEERAERGLDDYKVGELVEWGHKPRDGYGYTIRIPAKVVKVGSSRIRLEFKSSDGKLEAAWVSKSSVMKVEDTNEIGKV